MTVSPRKRALALMRGAGSGQRGGSKEKEKNDWLPAADFVFPESPVVVRREAKKSPSPSKDLKKRRVSTLIRRLDLPSVPSSTASPPSLRRTRRQSLALARPLVTSPPQTISKLPRPSSRSGLPPKPETSENRLEARRRSLRSRRLPPSKSAPKVSEAPKPPVRSTKSTSVMPRQKEEEAESPPRVKRGDRRASLRVTRLPVVNYLDSKTHMNIIESDIVVSPRKRKIDTLNSPKSPSKKAKLVKAVSSSALPQKTQNSPVVVSNTHKSTSNLKLRGRPLGSKNRATPKAKTPNSNQKPRGRPLGSKNRATPKAKTPTPKKSPSPKIKTPKSIKKILFSPDKKGPRDRTVSPSLRSTTPSSKGAKGKTLAKIASPSPKPKAKKDVKRGATPKATPKKVATIKKSPTSSPVFRSTRSNSPRVRSGSRVKTPKSVKRLKKVATPSSKITVEKLNAMKSANQLDTPSPIIRHQKLVTMRSTTNKVVSPSPKTKSDKLKSVKSASKITTPSPKLKSVKYAKKLATPSPKIKSNKIKSVKSASKITTPSPKLKSVKSATKRATPSPKPKVKSPNMSSGYKSNQREAKRETRSTSVKATRRVTLNATSPVHSSTSFRKTPSSKNTIDIDEVDLGSSPALPSARVHLTLIRGSSPLRGTSPLRSTRKPMEMKKNCTTPNTPRAAPTPREALKRTMKDHVDSQLDTVVTKADIHGPSSNKCNSPGNASASSLWMPSTPSSLSGLPPTPKSSQSQRSITINRTSESRRTLLNFGGSQNSSLRASTLLKDTDESEEEIEEEEEEEEAEVVEEEEEEEEEEKEEEEEEEEEEDEEEEEEDAPEAKKSKRSYCVMM